MVWPIIIAGVVSAAGAVYSGISSSNTASQNADAAQAAAAVNANNVKNQAVINNQANMMLSMMNANLITSNANTNAEAVNAVTAYNVSLLADVNEYYQLLWDDELDQLYESEGLEQLYMEKNQRRYVGNMIAQQGASGTTVGVGSNRDAVIEANAEFMLQSEVLAMQYDRQANGIRNAMAKGAWDTQQQINTLQYEASISNFTASTNAYNQARSGVLSTMISGWAGTQSASNQASTIMSGGSAQSSMYNNQANQILTASVINGASSIANTYAQTYTGSSSTTGQTSLLSTNANTGMNESPLVRG